MYTQISMKLNLIAREKVMDLKKVSAMKFFCAIVLFANTIACISICNSATSNSKGVTKENIQEYDNGSQLTQDLCQFIGVSNPQIVTKSKTKKLKNIVVYWDCDNVLQKDTDLSLVGNRIWNFMKGEGTDFCQITIWNSPKSIVELSIRTLVQHLKRCNVTQFVVTQCTSDPETQYKREKILNCLGYSFEKNILENDKTFQDKCNQIKDSCPLSLKPGQTKITPPSFSHGIAYTGSATKEVMFEYLFDLIQSSEKFCDIADVTFVFIDDKLKNLEEFCSVCRKRGIKKYRAYHYTNVLHHLNSETLTDKSIENMQKDLIRKENRFIGYNDVRYLTKIFPLAQLTFR